MKRVLAKHSCTVICAVVFAFGLVAQDKSAQVRQAKESVWILREDGIGPAKIGMTLAQLKPMLSDKVSTPEDRDEEDCFYVTPKRHPKVAFMVEDGRLSRIDVDGSGISTETGIAVGDLEVRVLRAYRHDLKVEPDAYTAPDGHYLTLHKPKSPYAIRFDTYKGRVEHIYAGRFESVQYIEGCE